MRHQPRTLHPLHCDTHNQSQDQNSLYTTPTPPSLSFRAASLPLPVPIPETIDTPSSPSLSPSSKHNREHISHSKRLRKGGKATKPLIDEESVLSTGTNRREKGKERSAPDHFWSDVWANSRGEPVNSKEASGGDWPELPARHGRGGREISTEVRLADLIRPAKTGKKAKDPDFELVPHVRSVIVLDDSSTLAGGEPDSDSPWEYLSSVALSDDEGDEQSRAVLSYAEIVAKTH